MTTYAPPTARPATDKQLGFIRNLLAEREGIAAAEGIRYWLNEARLADTLTTRTASQAIEALLAIRKPAGAPRAAASSAVTLDDGVYKRPTGEIVRVYHTIHGRNIQVGKVLVVTDNGDDTFSAEFEYGGKAALNGLAADMRMTEDEAKAFGRMYHLCCRCSTPLTRDESNHVGYGKTCAGHEGWWYPTKSELRALTASELAAAAG